MNKTHYKLDIILRMRVASCFKNNAAAVEESVKSFQNWLLRHTEAGLVRSKTVNEKLSWVWFLFQLDCAVLHWGNPMHMLLLQ